MKILLTGHGCAPDMGSEPGVTWNWALSLSRDNDVWVITHAYFRPTVERYLAAHPQPRLHFVYTERMGWWDPLRLPSLRGIRFHYLFWRRAVLRLARTLDAEHDFDLVHHVSWNTVSAPPLLGGVGKPFVWGPVGGGQVTAWPLLGCYGWGMPVELLRSLRVWLLPLLPGVRRTVAQADAVFAANRETAAVLRRAGTSAVPLLLDCAVPGHLLAEPVRPRPQGQPFTVLWSGRIEPRKAISLCLEAVRHAATPGLQVLVAGSGPGLDAARRLAARLGVTDRVQFLGQLPWPEMQRLYQTVHLLLFTSIRDTSGNVALEALAAGVPVICIDHQGMGSHLPDDAAVKVPVGRPGTVARAMAKAIDILAADRPRWSAMSRAARLYAESEVWERRAAAMQVRYAEILRQRARPGLAGLDAALMT